MKVYKEVIRYESAPLSARHHEKGTTEPVSFFFTNMEELHSWNPTSQDMFNIAVTPLAKRYPPIASQRAKTLVCHDMMGGYLEDRFIQGTDSKDPYVFYHWQYIDIFVYFSHQMFTLPPVCWTNAAHKHGVSVLGTFITEWEDGAKACESFLAGDESAYKAVADQMVALARFYRFDGWLVNIENVLSPVAVSRVPLFLSYLTEKLHAQVPGGLVLWYDSVIHTGELKWQNELNDENRQFFSSCDGMFTNYNWKEDHLQRMAAEPRKTDVYIGVDIFARGDVVGGKFETFKSLEMIRQYGFSAALFAPGWIYECFNREQFLENQHRFWSLLEKHLYSHSLSTLPICSSFCLGRGKKRFSYGQAEDVGPWFNLSAQELQPIFSEVTIDEGVSNVKSRICPQDAWHGGNCLLIEGALSADTKGVSLKLFSLNIPAPEKLMLSVVYKLEDAPNVLLSLELSTQDAPLCGIESVTEITGGAASQIHTLEPLSTPPTFLTTPEQDKISGWLKRFYEVQLSGCLLTSLAVHISRTKHNGEDESFVCRIGEIRLLDASLPLQRPLQPSDLTLTHIHWRRDQQTNQLFVSLTLHWSHSMDNIRHFRIYSRGVTCHRAPDAQPHLLGLAHACIYRVVDLAVPNPCPSAPGRIEFTVQPVNKDTVEVLPPVWGHLALEFVEQTHTEV
ncbi:cytosolic endo-beta-N-acetylglucosaminidase isoform 1-T1 [Anomaloglossus baeobatrachus]|uniref:cytosolic endo-beta-N-acetylglucosaminidase isoform X1 n=1 Tax=Anomaloglossus baeobatrachus TaxID=238106 RepID=UPI003F50A7A4